jgi:hypothetical protein
MKTKTILTFTLLIILTITSQAQNAFWAKGFATGTCDMLASDASGNIYAAAVFSDTIEIDGVEIIPENPYNSWLAKFNPAGELQWIVNITSTNMVYVRDLIVDNNGNVVIAGSSLGMVDFGPLLMGNESDNFGRAFIAVYNPEGTCIDITGTNGETNVHFVAIATDAAGNYGVCGVSEGSFAHGVELVPFYGGTDAIYGMFNSDLDPIWMKTIGGPDGDGGCAIEFDSNGELILSGYFEGDFMLTDVPFSSYGDVDIFLVKTDTDGYFHWLRTLGSENSEYQYWMDLELDANDYIYLAANMNEEISHQGGTNTSYGSTDFFVTRYNSAGGFDWFIHGGGEADDLMYGMTKGNNDNLYVYGYFTGAFETDGLVLYADVAYDGFYCEIGTDGSANLVAQTDGDDTESYTAAVVDINNNLIGAGIATQNITFEGAGTIDGIAEITTFLVKYETVYSIPEVGIEENDHPLNFQLYPNPTNNSINFDFTESKIPGKEIIIINASGVEIARYKMTDNFHSEINVDAMPSGLYNAIIFSDDNIKIGAKAFEVID